MVNVTQPQPRQLDSAGLRPPFDFHARLPRFTGDNRRSNQALIDALGTLATEKRITRTQLAVAWVLAKGSNIVPLIGARRRTQLDVSLTALNVSLSPEDMARIDDALAAQPVAGQRYDEHQMQMLDSER